MLLCPFAAIFNSSCLTALIQHALVVPGTKVTPPPPGDKYNHQEPSKKEQKLPRSLQELLATTKKTCQDRFCASN